VYNNPESASRHHPPHEMIIQVVSTLLQKCRASLLLSNLILIACPDTSTFAKLARFRKALPNALVSCCGEEIKTSLMQKNVEHITIATLGRMTTFSIVLDKRVLADMNNPVIEISPRQLILVPQLELIKECLAYEGACGIIGMSNHTGYFSNAQIVLSSNAHPNDWLGKKMSDWWIQPELDEYLGRLRHDGKLENYSYVAKMMTGENARLTVDSRLIVWNGEPARLVKTISRELLS
jgi:hypothetical protein